MVETLDAAPTTDPTYDSTSWWKRLDAKGDWANTDEDHSIAIDVLGNDKDPDGDPLKVATIAETKVDTDPTTDTPDVVTLDKGMATVKLNADGSLTYTEVYPFQLEPRW